MNLKKKLSLLFLLLIFLTTGCVTQNGGGTTPTPTNQNYDVIWWGIFDSEDVIKPLLEKYKTLKPNINVKYLHITEGLAEGKLVESYRARLDENLVDGEALDTPDIVSIHNTWLGRYSPYLVPAGSSQFTSDQIKNDYFNVVSSDFVRGTSVFAVPLQMDSLALIVNKDLLLKQSPVDSAGPQNNWFDFRDQSIRLTKYNSQNKPEIFGFSGGAQNAQFASGVLSLLWLQSNIKITDKDAVSGFSSNMVLSADQESQSIADFYQKFAIEQNKQSWSSDVKSEVSEFLSQKLVIYAAPSWRLNDILNLSKQANLNLNIEVYPMPQINPADQARNIQWADYWGLAVTSDSQKRGQSTAAWDFIKFLSTEEQLRTLSTNVAKQQNRKVGIIYPKKSLAQELKSDKYLKIYVENLEKAQSWDMVDGFLVDAIIKNSLSNGDINVKNIENEVNAKVLNVRTTLLTK